MSDRSNNQEQSAIHDDHLNVVSPEELDRLAMESDDGTVNVSIEVLEQLKELDRLRAEKAALTASNNKAQRELRQRAIRDACLPTTIGGRDGIPHTELNVVVGNSPDQLAANARTMLTSLNEGVANAPFQGNTTIALVPVIIYPFALDKGPSSYAKDAKGKPLNDFDLGETRLQRTSTTVTVRDPSTGKPREVLINGYARLQIDTWAMSRNYTPESIDEQAERTSTRLTFNKFGDLTESEDDGNSLFIPSQATDAAPSDAESTPATL